MIGTPGWNVMLAERRIRPYFPLFAEIGRTRRRSLPQGPAVVLPVRGRTEPEATTDIDWARQAPDEEFLARLLAAPDEP